MGGNDENDPRDELSKWIDAQRAEISKFQAQLQKDLSGWVDKSPSSSSSTEDRGPFRRFKAFVDDNLSTIYTGFRHFPSNVAELKARMQEEREARQAEERDIWYRWTGREDSPDHIRMEIDRATAEERKEARASVAMLLDEAARKNSRVPMEKLRALYVDHEPNPGALDVFASPMLSFGGACYYKEETVDNLPSTARWGWPAPKPRWLSVDWFKRSPYSPIRLEADASTAGDVLQWRAAFEDLVCAALDKPMESSAERFGQRYPHGRMQSTRFGPGLDWMLSLQCRGILPPQVPSLYKYAHPFESLEGVSYSHVDGKWIINGQRSTHPCIALDRDAHQLLEEISIKSGSKALWGRPKDAVYYEQMRQLGGGAEKRIEASYRQKSQQPMRADEEPDLPVTPWTVPETEAELYEQFPPTLPASPPLQTPPYPPPYPYPVAGAEYEEAEDEEDEWDVKEGDMYGYITEAEEHARMLDVESRLAEKASEAKAMSTNRLAGDKDEDGTERAKKHAQRSLDQDVSPSTAKAVNDTTASRSAILAQLTTTQTTRSPDGTVTTKVVLKQRFADGTEQEHESVHTSHEGVSKPETEQQVRESDKKEQKNGWFWT